MFSIGSGAALGAALKRAEKKIRDAGLGEELEFLYGAKSARGVLEDANRELRKIYSTLNQIRCDIYQILKVFSLNNFNFKTDSSILNIPTDMAIEEIRNKLSVRAYQCLKNAGVKTIRELAEKDDQGLLKIRNLGRHSLAEINSVLSDLGITTEIRQALRRED